MTKRITLALLLIFISQITQLASADEGTFASWFDTPSPSSFDIKQNWGELPPLNMDEQIIYNDKETGRKIFTSTQDKKIPKIILTLPGSDNLIYINIEQTIQEKQAKRREFFAETETGRDIVSDRELLRADKLDERASPEKYTQNIDTGPENHNLGKKKYKNQRRKTGIKNQKKSKKKKKGNPRKKIKKV